MYWNMCCAVDWMLQNRLTLTWDVLKSVAPRQNAPTGAGLTLTWDVLKFVLFSFVCIMQYWLTLTWDVLKFINT